MAEKIAFGESAEMYLKSIHELADESGLVPISTLAERLGITAVSAGEMIRRLQEQKLVEHQPYKGVALTAPGRRQASSILRRQRLWECFLSVQLGLPWERLYELACQLEHSVGAEVTEALAAFLGHPAYCPHGNPIPSPEGKWEPPIGRPLSELTPGDQATIRRVAAVGSDSLHYLAEHGLVPGTLVTLESIEPTDQLRRLRTAQGEVVVGSQMAHQIHVVAPESNGA
jgi:DtxR family Mn-dependent transcriptional regulator